MKRTRRVDVPRDVTAPAAGRRFVREALSDYPAAVPAAELVISELLTNAVIHQPSRTEPVHVRIDIQRDTARLSVDLSPGYEINSDQPRGSVEGGFGLAIVRALCGRWGVDRDGRPTTWCEIDLAAARAAGKAI